MLGIQDCLTKSFGSNNPKNLVKAVIRGLSQLRSKSVVAALRRVELAPTEVEEAIKRSQSYITTTDRVIEVATAPVEAHHGGRKKTGGRRRPKAPEPKSQAPKIQAPKSPASQPPPVAQTQDKPDVPAPTPDKPEESS